MVSSQISIIVYNNSVYSLTKQSIEDKKYGVYCGGCDFHNTKQCYNVNCDGLESNIIWKLDVNLTRMEKLKQILNGEG